MAVGAVVGAVALSAGRLSSGRWLLALGASIMGLAAIGSAQAPVIGVTTLMFGILGAGNVMYIIGLRTTLQHLTPTHMRGRVFGLWLATIQLGIMLGAAGAALVAALPSRKGSGLPFAVTGALLVVVALTRLLPGRATERGHASESFYADATTGALT